MLTSLFVQQRQKKTVTANLAPIHIYVIIYSALLVTSYLSYLLTSYLLHVGHLSSGPLHASYLNGHTNLDLSKEVWIELQCEHDQKAICGINHEQIINPSRFQLA